MIRLLIRQGPFYITAFTALFVALDNAGWLVNLKPRLMEEAAAPMSDSCFIQDGQEVCLRILPFTSMEFVEEQIGVEWWVAAAVLLVGTIIIGFTARRLWEMVFD